MKNTIDIMGTEVALKEYKGQRVVTFKDIDAVHGKKSGTARKRFNDNKKHFVKDVDYFVTKTDEAYKLFNITAPNGLILITETGYLMLVKSFMDDLAWQVQRCLVNTYFKAKDVASGGNPCSYAQAKDRIALWKRKVSNPLIERIIMLTDAEDFVSAYTCVYRSMKINCGFDMNKAKFDYCRTYGVDYEKCSVIDCIADNEKLRKSFEECAFQKIRELSEEKLEQTKRVAERKIREAEDLVVCSDKMIQKIEQLSGELSAQLDITDGQCNCALN